ncbi:hypothetical protein BDW66DRAFT_2849 [Aspergillus desertorum]
MATVSQHERDNQLLTTHAHLWLASSLSCCERSQRQAEASARNAAGGTIAPNNILHVKGETKPAAVLKFFSTSNCLTLLNSSPSTPFSDDYLSPHCSVLGPLARRLGWLIVNQSSNLRWRRRSLTLFLTSCLSQRCMYQHWMLSYILLLISVAKVSNPARGI